MRTRLPAVGRVLGYWRAERRTIFQGWVACTISSVGDLTAGLTLGAIGFLRAAATPASVLAGADRWMLALVIAQAVAIICLWGTLVGSLLPMIFRRLGFG